MGVRVRVSVRLRMEREGESESKSEGESESEKEIRNSNRIGGTGFQQMPCATPCSMALKFNSEAAHERIKISAGAVDCKIHWPKARPTRAGATEYACCPQICTPLGYA